MMGTEAGIDDKRVGEISLVFLDHAGCADGEFFRCMYFDSE